MWQMTDNEFREQNGKINGWITNYDNAWNKSAAKTQQGHWFLISYVSLFRFQRILRFLIEKYQLTAFQWPHIALWAQENCSRDRKTPQQLLKAREAGALYVTLNSITMFGIICSIQETKFWGTLDVRMSCSPRPLDVLSRMCHHWLISLITSLLLVKIKNKFREGPYLCRSPNVKVPTIFPNKKTTGMKQRTSAFPKVPTWPPSSVMMKR